MHTTHTPGPWHLSDEINPLIENERGNVAVAQVFMYSEGTVGSLRPDAYADARLLAAAPDLLHALDWAFNDPDSGILGEDWATVARAALARATGEA